jgi:hypothetical protein
MAHFIAADESNKNFQLASDFIQYTNRSVFLTGKAGTGKTTFLKHIRSNCRKQMAVIAPTGVAAINAGGVTIHSFFQLPFLPHIPVFSGESNEDCIDRKALLSRLRIQSDKRKLFQQLELLIIDEISMVRCDIIDAIDTILRHYRNKVNIPFGGVQLLLIGDLFQLTPVAQDKEWQILSPHYESPYFFASKSIQEHQPAYIELNKIYRQKDAHFIDVLNMIRNNEIHEAGLNILHQRYEPQFNPNDNEGYITLTTHNSKADSINTIALNKISVSPVSFRAVVWQDFSEKNYPADEHLILKIGAQVMFIKNDQERIKRYYNGKIGVVEKIEEDTVWVHCKGEDELIEVKRFTWENIRYTAKQQTQQVEETVVGSFNQFPLRLAWAITIHKSQGLTFEKAVIDAGQAFAAGQVYVALSRCTSLEGLVLLSKITANSVRTDQRIKLFMENQPIDELANILEKDKSVFEKAILLDLFNFSNAKKTVEFIKQLLHENEHQFNTESKIFIDELSEKIDYIISISSKFESRLQSIYLDINNVNIQSELAHNIKKAAEWFVPQLNAFLTAIKNTPVITESRQLATEYNEAISNIYTVISLQVHVLTSCIKGFNLDEYYVVRNSFVLPAFYPNAYASINKQVSLKSERPDLFKQLKAVRDEICNTQNLPIYMVANGGSLEEMATYLPLNEQEMNQITGFGPIKTKKFGDQFLAVLIPYCASNHLSSSIHLKPTTKSTKQTSEKSTKIDTKKITFDLLNKGKSIDEIVSERNLTKSTIEGHLAYYIELGKLEVSTLVESEKIALIANAMKDYKLADGISAIKNKLDDSISYGEIRMVIASKKIAENGEI